MFFNPTIYKKCSNSMAEADTIKEGFLCPICHKDMRSPNNLISHFQSTHSEEQDILKSIKDIYGKAKKKIFKFEEQDLKSFKDELQTESYRLAYSEPQEPGPSKPHTDHFKTIRRDKLDHRTAETNKLIIRLDRLLRLFGSDRKQHEQELVVWLDGAVVSRCPSCTATFNITRRQHHCRLCGSIMCNSCSYFLSYELAEAIVAPVASSASVKESGPTSHNKDSDSLRICYHCLGMLECRRKVQAEQMMQPIICQLYSLLQKSKSQIQSSVDMYNKMYSSLMSGDTTFLLQDLQNLRTSIAEKAQMIDTLSKKIASLPIDAKTPKSVLLQNNVRRAMSTYIKDYLLDLPQPPTIEELERIRRHVLTQSINDDEANNSLPKRRQQVKRVMVTTGWSPADVSSNDVSGTEEQEDPLVQQMNIVRNYIDQARRAERFEEVESLQENLNMLKETYRQSLLPK